MACFDSKFPTEVPAEYTNSKYEQKITKLYDNAN